MERIRKATLGVRTADKLFRLSSLNGLIADDLISALNKSSGELTYFSSVLRPNGGSTLQLVNEERGRTLILDFENIALVHDFYDQEKAFDSSQMLSDFKLIWETIDSIMHIKRVRRVGFVAEYRFEKKSEVSAHLLSTLTKLKTHGYLAKFSLQYETRKPTGPHGLPDPSKDDFYNFIRQIYDGSLDNDHAEAGFFNANLDVQRYYAPSLLNGIPSATTQLYAEFEKAVIPFFDELKLLGLCDGKNQ